MQKHIVVITQQMLMNDSVRASSGRAANILTKYPVSCKISNVIDTIITLYV